MSPQFRTWVRWRASQARAAAWQHRVLRPWAAAWSAVDRRVNACRCWATNLTACKEGR